MDVASSTEKTSDATSIPLLSTVRMDVASLVFSVLLAALIGLLFGFIPALQVPSISVHDSLKDTSRASTGSKRHTWIHGGLVVSEIALACVLLVGADRKSTRLNSSH